MVYQCYKIFKNESQWNESKELDFLPDNNNDGLMNFHKDFDDKVSLREKENEHYLDLYCDVNIKECNQFYDKLEKQVNLEELKVMDCDDEEMFESIKLNHTEIPTHENLKEKKSKKNDETLKIGIQVKKREAFSCIKGYSCNFCIKTFAQKSKLIKHNKSAHRKMNKKIIKICVSSKNRFKDNFEG
ncbi:uncharacterized protein LOC106657407 [Trichogramma pretiosum]|uniref:uncharacterized protein LOC106657407 n=1 Tax=Trichogramma pretiosum TaxID=7493 RepID=UPI0006C9B8F1|nr:uncharacterized protein LOC106657407 [Trichogramma pretiosum]XP_014234422.1 uncharacterized protein LOC106657407 [Trichogramma pretiosum]